MFQNWCQVRPDFMFNLSLLFINVFLYFYLSLFSTQKAVEGADCINFNFFWRNKSSYSCKSFLVNSNGTKWLMVCTFILSPAQLHLVDKWGNYSKLQNLLIKTQGGGVINSEYSNYSHVFDSLLFYEHFLSVILH